MKKTEEMELKLKNDIEARFDLNRVSLTGDDQDQGRTVIYQMPGENATDP